MKGQGHRGGRRSKREFPTCSGIISSQGGLLMPMPQAVGWWQTGRVHECPAGLPAPLQPQATAASCPPTFPQLPLLGKAQEGGSKEGAGGSECWQSTPLQRQVGPQEASSRGFLFCCPFASSGEDQEAHRVVAASPAGLRELN